MSETKITFFDVGHGSCTHIQTPNGKNILVDIGGSDDFSPAYHLRWHEGVGQLDGLILTHGHEDHYHDILNLDKYGLKPTVLLRNHAGFPVSKNASNIIHHDKIDFVNNLNSTYNATVEPCNSPFWPGANGGVMFKSFFPDTQYQTKDDPNTYSGLYVFAYGGTKIVMTGDNNKEILKEMIRDREVVEYIKNADFLLAPHHGRTTDFCPEFFAVVNPRATIISDKRCEHDSQLGSACAYNNGRGIWLNGESRHVLTTRKDGNIVLRIDPFGNYSFDSWRHAA